MPRPSLGFAKSLCLPWKNSRNKVAKTFFLKGGECPLAITKERKEEVLSQYTDWMKRSQAVILVEYTGVKMKDLDNIRAKIREAGGEFHVVKNTIGRKAFEQAGLSAPAEMLEGSTAIGFAFDDAPASAKMVTDFARSSEHLQIKGGFLGAQSMDAAQVKALADLPPLPVMRARILGVLQAPAAQIVRMIN